MSEVANIPQLRFPGFSDEWEERPLKDVSTFFNGKAYKQAELLSSGKYPVLRVGNFFTNNSWYYSNLELDENKYCDNGDLLYAWSASFGPRIWAGEKVIYHYHIWKVINHSQVTKKFLFIVLDNETAKMKAQSANGFALLHITKGTIENWKINLPTRQEQQKIAAFLTAVDSKIEQLSKKKALLGEYKKGLMQQIFSQAIRFKADDGSDFPNWEEKKLGDILDYEQPTNYIVDSTEYDNSFDMPVLTAGKSFVLGYTNETHKVFENIPVIIFDDFTTANKYVDFPFKVKSSAMKILKPKDSFVNIRLIFEFIQMLNFPIGEHKRYWISEYQDLKIPFPSFEEQTKIANFLSSIDNKIEQVGKQLDESKQFKKALLQQMFV